MKTTLLTLAAVAVLASTASGDSRELRFERRWNANGQIYFLYVPADKSATAIAKHHQSDRDNRLSYVAEGERLLKTERRWDPHGQSFLVYVPVP